MKKSRSKEPFYSHDFPARRIPTVIQSIKFLMEQNNLEPLSADEMEEEEETLRPVTSTPINKRKGKKSVESDEEEEEVRDGRFEQNAQEMILSDSDGSDDFILPRKNLAKLTDRRKRKREEEEEEEDSEDDEPRRKKKKDAKKRRRVRDEETDEEVSDEENVVKKKVKKNKKVRDEETEEEEESDEENVKKKVKKNSKKE